MKSKKTDSYPTDLWIKDIFNDWFDPCSLSDDENLRLFDGLGSSWGKRTFVNPPYSNPLDWVRHSINENKKGKTVVFLLKHDSSTRWYKELHEAGAYFLMLNGRLKFGTGKSANFPSILAVLSGVNHDG